MISMSGNQNCMSWFSYMVCILVKHNIEASLHDGAGLFFWDPPSFPFIFSHNPPFWRAQKTVTLPHFPRPSPLLISDKSLTDPTRKQSASHGSATGKHCIFHSLQGTLLQSRWFCQVAGRSAYGRFGPKDSPGNKWIRCIWITIIKVELIFAGRSRASPIQLVRHASSATGSKFLFNLGHLKLIRFVVQSNAFNTEIERPWKLSVLSGLNLEKMYGLPFTRDKANCP